MTTPTVTELPPTMQPVTPPTFVFVAVPDDAPRAAGRPPQRRIVD